MITRERYYYLYTIYCAGGIKGGTRNELCICGSNKKYKKCCMLKDKAEQEEARKIFEDSGFKWNYNNFREKKGFDHNEAMDEYYNLLQQKNKL